MKAVAFESSESVWSVNELFCLLLYSFESSFFFNVEGVWVASLLESNLSSNLDKLLLSWFCFKGVCLNISNMFERSSSVDVSHVFLVTFVDVLSGVLELSFSWLLFCSLVLVGPSFLRFC